MAFPFPSLAWLEALVEILNSDERYAEVAKNWEGDIYVAIDPDGSSKDQVEPIAYYLDLWHGSCRGATFYETMPDDGPDALFTFQTTMGNIFKIFSGELDPIQAMLTRRLKVVGNMAYLLRNIPTVLDFIRCCRAVPMQLPSPGDDA
jgi:putative sterol carrier protein